MKVCQTEVMETRIKFVLRCNASLATNYNAECVEDGIRNCLSVIRIADRGVTIHCLTAFVLQARRTFFAVYFDPVRYFSPVPG